MLEVLIIMVLTALSCSLIGAFLMLRGTSMINAESSEYIYKPDSKKVGTLYKL